MKYILQHELDTEPSYITPADNPDADCITIAPGNYALARKILNLLNTPEDIEAAARNALQFIMTLRDSTPNEVLDLLTNNGGEDVEAELAAALGVDLTESEDDPDYDDQGNLLPGCNN